MQCKVISHLELVVPQVKYNMRTVDQNHPKTLSTYIILLAIWQNASPVE